MIFKNWWNDEKVQNLIQEQFNLNFEPESKELMTDDEKVRITNLLKNELNKLWYMEIWNTGKVVPERMDDNLCNIIRKNALLFGYTYRNWTKALNPNTGIDIRASAFNPVDNQEVENTGAENALDNAIDKTYNPLLLNENRLIYSKQLKQIFKDMIRAFKFYLIYLDEGSY
jgi:hypothetical protein